MSENKEDVVEVKTNEQMRKWASAFDGSQTKLNLGTNSVLIVATGYGMPGIIIDPRWVLEFISADEIIKQVPALQRYVDMSLERLTVERYAVLEEVLAEFGETITVVISNDTRR